MKSLAKQFVVVTTACAVNACVIASAAAQATWTVPTNAYYPDAGNGWLHRRATQEGLDSIKLAEAIAYAIARESKNPRDLEINHYQTFGREPFGVAVGPIADRKSVG